MSWSGAGMGSFFGKTPEGAVAEEMYIKMMGNMQLLSLLPDDDPKREELQRELDDMTGAFDGEVWKQKIAEKEAQGKKGMKIMGFRHGAR